MVKLACKGRKGFVASELENHPGPSFTIDTLERLRAQLNPRDRLFFLVGADAFDELRSWHRWRDMLSLAEFLVVTRPGHRYRVPKGARVHSLDGIAMLASSSGIRSRLAAGEPAPEIPKAVRAYIEAHSLYGAVKSRYGRDGSDH
jgi:nicotinate-nucleotide adenylyltransferase